MEDNTENKSAATTTIFNRETVDDQITKIVVEHFPKKQAKRLSGGYKSAVYLLQEDSKESEADKHSTILKTGSEDSIKSERTALRLWKEKGASVPAILSSSSDDSPQAWFEMENVDKADATSQIDPEKVNSSLADTLRLMHDTRTSGWGELQLDGIGKYSSIKESTDAKLSHFFMQEKALTFVSQNDSSLITKAHNWLNENLGLITDRGITPSVIHNDLNQSNWLITPENKVVVIDPIAEAGDPMQDIAHLICSFKCNGQWTPEIGQKFISNYFKDGLSPEQVGKIRYYQVSESILFMAKEALVGDPNNTAKLYLELANKLMSSSNNLSSISDISEL